MRYLYRYIPLLVSFAASAALAAPTYHLVDVGEPGAEAFGANGHGGIAAYVYVQGYGNRAAWYHHGKWSRLNDRGYESEAHDLDNHGNVVGKVFTQDKNQLPVYWPKGGSKVFISLTYPHDSGSADAISPDGSIVAGTGYDQTYEPRCFIWKLKGFAVDIGTLGGESCLPFAVNASGVVAGLADLASGDTHAYLYANGSMQDLGSLPGSHWSKAVALNAQAHAVGEAAMPDDSRRAIYWNGTSLSDLGTLGGSYGTASGINDQDEIVGVASDAAGTQHAFLYSGGTMIALETLVDNAQGWDLSWGGPVHIDDSGVIVGNGLLDGGGHIYVLVPVGQ